MDEKTRNNAKEVMVVRQAIDGKLKAVTGVDPEGNLQTVEPTEQNMADLLSVNAQDSLLEAFFKKFLQEADNPSHTGIFIMSEQVLGKLIQIDFEPELLEPYRIIPGNPAQEQEQQTFEPMDVSKIDLDDLVKKGIRMEDLEPHLRAMSYGHKSNGLVEMSPELESGLRIPTKGRVSLEEQPDGSLRIIPHYWQEKVDFSVPFHGVLLDEETIKNIETTRHAGKIINLELEPGKTTPCFVSRDKWTNTLEYMPVELLEKRTAIKNAELSEGKQIDFYSGGKVLLEGYTTRAGYKRDAYIQIDASERNYEFSYAGLNRNRYIDENREIYRRKQAEQTGQEIPVPRINIHHSILGASVPDEAYKQWSEAVDDPTKQKEVRAFYIQGMVKDRQEEPFNAWVKPDFEQGKMKFYRWDPDRAKRQGATAKPTNENRTQVAVNSEGKTVEAVKNIQEPLKQEQRQPNAAQRAQSIRQRQPNKAKGVKM
ncbi:MAG: DUF3945 domain-containing protein [Bacteroides cellulosilyticus]|nr:DUF3945 domain-containing protein [Bacteroides cellulosilyticus]